MITGKLIYQAELDKIIDLRKQVIYDETGILYEDLYEIRDQESIHAMILEDIGSNKIVGTGRIYFDGNEFTIDNIAVLTNYRRKGYGDFAVRLLINKAISSGANLIILNAQYKYIDFYKTIGFQLKNEIVFEVNGIAHIQMEINRENITTQCRNRK